MGKLNVKPRTIFCRDNLDILQGLNAQCIDLIYLDPPFNKNKIFSSPMGSSAEGAGFRDIFRKEDIKDEWVKSIEFENAELHAYLSGVKEFGNQYNYCYLVYMAIRLIECHRVLKDNGSIYLHCDPTMSHYLKIVLDCIFGEKRFRNEIIWYYKNASRGKKVLAKAHDVVFWYSKTNTYIFNREDVLVPFESGMTEWRYKRGGQSGKAMPKGKTPDDVYVMPSLNTMSKERTDYPTQKPLALIEKFVLASSNEGDMVLDPFCGCATTCVAAEKLGRQWIGVDVSHKTYEEVKKRIKKEVTLPLVEEEPNFTTVPPKRGKDEPKEQGYVYIIGHEIYPGEFKVGIAKDPKSRLNTFQTGDPKRGYELLFKHQTPYYKEIEQHIHKKFNADYEWVKGDFEAIKKAIKAADKKLSGG